jgi:hypothetical protein
MVEEADMGEGGAQPDLWGTSERRYNSSLAAKFIQELLDQPENSEPIPLGATVILMPPEGDPDPELAAANMRRAEELAAEGSTVILWTVGKEPPYAAMPDVPSLAATTKS